MDTDNGFPDLVPFFHSNELVMDTIICLLNLQCLQKSEITYDIGLLPSFSVDKYLMAHAYEKFTLTFNINMVPST